jgi:TolA-binding protein
MLSKISYSFCVAATLVFGAALPHAHGEGTNDRIRLVKGSETGEVTNMTPFEVTYERSFSGKQTAAVNQIKAIIFSEEPGELAQARVQAGNGAYAKAIQLLEKIDMGQVRRDFIKQDIEFYKAYCAGKLALAGEGQIAEAGGLINSFVKNYPSNYHFLEASELMGDMLMAAGRYENAEKQYAELAKAPWPEYKMRADVNLGRSLQAQKKHAAAIQKFDAALGQSGDGANAENQKLSATLGKAVSMAESGKVNDAVASIQKVIQDADPQQKELHARAYNALGTCYEKSKQNKEALFAFLHVDVVYNNVPEAHAEALSHLVPLWKAVGQDERSREAREMLQQKYANSKWAKGVQ